MKVRNILIASAIGLIGLGGLLVGNPDENPNRHRTWDWNSYVQIYHRPSQDADYQGYCERLRQHYKNRDDVVFEEYNEDKCKFFCQDTPYGRVQGPGWNNEKDSGSRTKDEWTEYIKPYDALEQRCDAALAKDRVSKQALGAFMVSREFVRKQVSQAKQSAQSLLKH